MKKWLMLLIIISTLFALYVSWDWLRFLIIRATYDTNLPVWLKSFLWGWY